MEGLGGDKEPSLQAVLWINPIFFFFFKSTSIRNSPTHLWSIPIAEFSVYPTHTFFKWNKWIRSCLPSIYKLQVACVPFVIPFIQWSKAIFVLIWFYLYKLWRNAYYHLWLFFPDPVLKEISLYSLSLHRGEISRPLNKELSIFWWWWFSRWVMPDFYDPMDCSPPGSSIHGISQVRILEWVAISLTRGSSQPRDWTRIACNAGRFFTDGATREAQKSIEIVSKVLVISSDK